MISQIKNKAKEWLLWSQEYTKIDMLYLAKGSFWFSSSFFLTSLLGLIQVIIFGNFLPKEAYGTYRYILSLAGSFSFLTLTGMGTAVIQAVASSGSSAILPFSVKFQTKWNFIFSAALIALSVYYFINDNFTICLSLFLVGLTYPLTAAYNTYGAFLAGKKDFKRSSLYSTISAFIQIASLSITALITTNIIALIGVYALSHLLPQVFFHFRTLKIYGSGTINEQERSELLKYGGHLSGMQILSNIAQYIDKIVIFHYLGAIELAIYGLALALPERIKGLIKNTGSIIMPKLSERTLIEVDKIFIRRIMEGMLIGSVFTIIYIALSPLFYKIFLPKYLEAITYSQVFSLIFIFTIPSIYIGSVFSAHKLVRSLYYSGISSGLFKITLYFFLGRTFGIWGVIFATLAFNFLAIFYGIYLWKLEIKRHKTSFP